MSRVRYVCASARPYGDGTLVQRGISGSWQAATRASTSCAPGRRIVMTPSVRIGMAGVCPHLPPLVRAVFWISAALLAWTQALYAPALALLRRAKGSPPTAPDGDVTPSVTLIVAAYREEAVIGARVANARALDSPGLHVIVAVDGGDAGTVERARHADRVLELPRGGK